MSSLMWCYAHVFHLNVPIGTSSAPSKMGRHVPLRGHIGLREGRQGLGPSVGLLFGSHIGSEKGLSPMRRYGVRYGDGSPWRVHPRSTRGNWSTAVAAVTVVAGECTVE